MSPTFRRNACRGAVVLCLLAAAPVAGALAGVATSKHDFAALAVAPGGTCSGCHVPHSAQGPYHWPRDLTEETGYFTQTLNPNYVRGDTVHCYDCHDNHGTVDNDPADASFFFLRIPQDVAFDADMKTTAVPRDGLPDDDELGYYEKPTSGTLISGHYIKNPTGGNGISVGDKLPCNDCHDPHETRNQAFIRVPLAGKNIVGVRASAAMAYTELSDDRNDADSRTFCIACHGTAEQALFVAVSFSEINPQYGPNKIAVPPAYVGAHAASSETACTSCHGHNGSAASCTECHGGGIASEGNDNTWPDGLGVAPKGNQYPNRPGKHAGHVAAIAIARYGAAPTTAEKNSTCDTCHPNPGGLGHETNTSGSPASTADVHRDAQNQTTHFKTVSGAANGVFTESYDNTVVANGKDCQNVDCHYRVSTPVLGMATADGDGWFQPLAVASCSSCHGSGSSGVALPEAHQQHVGSLATQKAYGCWYCHPSGVNNAAYTVGHQSGAVDWSFTNTLDPGGTRTETYSGQATGTTAVKFGTGAFSSCAAVYCHIQTSPLWDAVIGATDCTLCHQTGETAPPNPSSGLHYGSTPPAVSGTWHDDTLNAAAKCTVCHTGVLSQGTHVDGTFAGGFGQTDRMGLFPDYQQTADGVGACSGAPGTVGGAGCHAGPGDAGTWKRAWDASIHFSAAPGVACRGCHAGFAGDWTFGAAHDAADGSTEHAWNWDGDANGPEVMTNHKTCKSCHGMNSQGDKNGAYLAASMWDPTGATSMHGDGSIQMNGPTPSTGTGYSSADWGCDNAAVCHGGAASLHNLEDSAWPVAAVDFGGAACDSCHGYPPTGTESPTPFLDHGSRIPGTASDAGFLGAHNACALCHGVRGNLNTPPDGFVYTDLTPVGGDVYTPGLHRDGTVQVNGISVPDNNQNTDYQTAGGGCARACHAASWTIAASYPTAAPKSLLEFGSGSCEGCHNGSQPPAPNVMTYWSGSAAGQDGGHGDAGGAAALACADCHDTNLPAAPFSARHATGTYNSIWANDGTRSENTAHLKAGFFTEFPANAPGGWSVQVAIDNYCTWKCHDVDRDGVWDATEPAALHRHSRDVPPGAGNEWSVEFGTHLTQPAANADGIADIPIDIDLNTAAGGYYAPCTSCHDPHGTGAANLASRPSNRMLRFTGPDGGNNLLCAKCHI